MTRWIIKIGTSLLRGNKEIDTYTVINNYCSHIAKAKKKGDQIIVVSSGAVGLGCYRLGMKERPKDISSLQAAAALGQSHLMALYEKAMDNYGYKVAQILLTRAELGTRECYQNASRTLNKLLDWNLIPVVNENDTISNEELKYGDNDTLSALVATAISADQLILLTDIDHLYSADPKFDFEAKPITDVHHPEELKTFEETNNKKGEWGTGGIRTKLIAARIATESGIKVQLADGRDPKILKDLLEGLRVGTVFHPHPKPIGNKKSWLAHAIKPVGEISLDHGASFAIQEKGASLLLVGINGLEGDFGPNQPVKILNKDRKEIARGICSLSSEAIKNALNNSISSKKSPIVIHRDALVLTSELVS